MLSLGFYRPSTYMRALHTIPSGQICWDPVARCCGVRRFSRPILCNSIFKCIQPGDILYTYTTPPDLPPGSTSLAVNYIQSNHIRDFKRDGGVFRAMTMANENTRNSNLLVDPRIVLESSYFWSLQMTYSVVT